MTKAIAQMTQAMAVSTAQFTAAIAKVQAALKRPGFRGTIPPGQYQVQAYNQVFVSRGKRGGMANPFSSLHLKPTNEIDEWHEQGGIRWDHSKAPTSAPDKIGYMYGLRQWLLQTPHQYVEYKTLLTAPLTDDYFEGNERLEETWAPLQLYSINGDARWNMGVETKAYCSQSWFHRQQTGVPEKAYDDFEVPDPRCNCGLWGVFDLRDLPLRGRQLGIYRNGETGADSLIITGLIKSWGLIVEGDKGFRAEYAQPIAFCQDWDYTYWPETAPPGDRQQEMRRDLARTFDVPLWNGRQLWREFNLLREGT